MSVRPGGVQQLDTGSFHRGDGAFGTEGPAPRVNVLSRVEGCIP